MSDLNVPIARGANLPPVSNLIGKHVLYINVGGVWVIGEVLGTPRESARGVG